MSGVALITGGRRGIGFGIATALANEGWKIALNDIASDENVQECMDELKSTGAHCEYFKADISDSDDRVELVNSVLDSFGRIDLLVNNAGVAPEVRTDILKAGESSYERVMNINLKGPYFLTQIVAGHMIENKDHSPDQFRAVVNVASSNSLAASPDRGEYCVSKAGASMSTRLWAVRLAEFDIPVYEVRPGIIRTDMTRPVTDKYDRKIEEGLLLQKRWGEPEDVGKAVAMLARGDLPYSTGQIIYVDGGQLIPRL
jgi:NAD(P)-dependent dehydrogenase (short-subunit alcohol dehydrogenase family)